MRFSIASAARFTIGRAALVALGSACVLGIVPVQAAKAADAPVLRSLADKAPDLPLTPTFDKVADGETGPYVLNLKNISKDSINVSATIVPSVAFHADAKVRNLPGHVIDPGQVWSIPGLAATDKVTITADGFAPLELTVP